MGRAHSNAWLNVSRFFDCDPRPVMHTVISRNTGRAGGVRRALGMAQRAVDWRRGVTDDAVDLVDIGTEQRACRTGDRRSRRQARRLREAARRTLADAETMAAAAAAAGVRPSSGTTTGESPPWRSPTNWWPPGPWVGCITLAPSTCRVGAVSTPLLWRFQGDVAGSSARRPERPHHRCGPLRHR